MERRRDALAVSSFGRIAMSPAGSKPLVIVLLAGVLLATAGCSPRFDPVSPSPTSSATSSAFDDELAKKDKIFPKMGFDETADFAEGTQFEFVPDFRASEGWREGSIVPQIDGGLPSSSGSYSKADESCTIAWTIDHGEPGDDRAGSQALLDKAATPGSTRDESLLPAEHPDGSTAGSVDVATALSPDETKYVWARDMGGVLIVVTADCATSEANANAYSVVHESLPFVVSRPDEIKD
jgi:hypothetical protein